MKKVLYKNAIFVPMTDRETTFSYMGVCGEQIQYIGNEEPEGYENIVDLAGQYVYPALCDSHLQLLYSVVLAASSFDICRFAKEGIQPSTMQGVEESVRAFAAQHHREKLLVANQYIPSAIKECRLPTKQELDLWTHGKEIVIFCIDGHSCAVSTALLTKLGLHSQTGILTGSDYDMNQGKITGYIASKVSLVSLARGVANFQNECFHYGISKICALDGDDDGSGKDILLRLTVLLARHMKLRVRLFPQYMHFDVLRKIGKKMHHLRIGGCSKWELDGSVGSHSASFYHPYVDNGAMSAPYYEDDFIQQKIQDGLSKGCTMSAHAIGTRAIDQLVNAYKKCSDLIPQKGPMCRIDHFEFPSETAKDFVKSNPLAITLQPGYAFLDKRYIKSYERFLPKEEIAMQCPIKEMMDAGVVVLGSSDSPVQSVNPYDQMRGMTDFYLKEESVDAFDAFKTYTVNPGIALDEKSGCLQEGYCADFFTADVDILHAKAENIGDVVANSLYIGGKKMKKQKSDLLAFFGMLLRPGKKL